MRKAPVGLFNIKKSKNKEVEEFEASDEWLMGLADDQDDQFDPVGIGPNASIPQGLASLAPAEDRRFDPLLADHEPSSFDQSDSSELLESDDIDLSSWHFPDLAQPALDQIGDHAPQPTDTSFDEHWSDGSTFEPFPDGQGPESDLGDDHRDDHVGDLDIDRHSDDQDEIDSDIEDAVLDDDDDDDNVDVMAAIGSGQPPVVEPLPQVELASHPVVAPVNDRHDDHDATSSQVPRSSEADMLCEILGVEGGANWADLRAAHAAAMSEYDPRLESDEDRVALASAIRREMNSTYAALRLLAAG